MAHVLRKEREERKTLKKGEKSENGFAIFLCGINRKKNVEN